MTHRHEETTTEESEVTEVTEAAELDNDTDVPPEVDEDTVPTVRTEGDDEGADDAEA